jgi:glycosyltransferase involved in cell wall biosynthesis
LNLNLQEIDMADIYQLKKKALLVVHMESCFQGLLNIAKMLRESEKYEPIFLFEEDNYPSSCLHRDIQICVTENIAHLNVFGSEGARYLGSLRERKISLAYRIAPPALAKFIDPVIRRTGIAIYNNAVYQFFKLYLRLRYLRGLIRREDISLVVLGFDLAQYNTAVHVKAAHLEKRPAVVVTDIMTSASEFGELYYNNPKHRVKNLSDRLIEKLYPRWVLNYKGRKLLRLPSAGMILAKELLGLAPPLPWQYHSSYADAVLVESTELRDFGIANGLPAEQLIATGTVSQDIMANAIKNASTLRHDLYKRLGFGEDKPMILVALPQDDHPKGYERPFPTYEDMVNFFVNSVVSCNEYNIVVCLHPSTHYEDVRYIEQMGVKITQEPTASLIPLCDIYVSTVSSTIKWAIACGKPVIAYDYNRHRRSDFKEAKGVIVVEKKEEFIDMLCRLTEDRKFYDEISTKQKSCAERWGKLDGQGGARILKVFDELITKTSTTTQPSIVQ